MDSWRSGMEMLEAGDDDQMVLEGDESEWCSEAEYLDGAWVTREEEVTLDNIRRIYKFTVSFLGSLYGGHLLTFQSSPPASSNVKPRTTGAIHRPMIPPFGRASSRQRSTNGSRTVDAGSMSLTSGTLQSIA